MQRHAMWLQLMISASIIIPLVWLHLLYATTQWCKMIPNDSRESWIPPSRYSTPLEHGRPYKQRPVLDSGIDHQTSSVACKSLIHRPARFVGFWQVFPCSWDFFRDDPVDIGINDRTICWAEHGPHCPSPTKSTLQISGFLGRLATLEMHVTLKTRPLFFLNHCY